MSKKVECEKCRLKGTIKDKDFIPECPVCGTQMILIKGEDKDEILSNNQRPR